MLLNTEADRTLHRPIYILRTLGTFTMQQQYINGEYKHINCIHVCSRT